MFKEGGTGEGEEGGMPTPACRSFYRCAALRLEDCSFFCARCLFVICRTGLDWTDVIGLVCLGFVGFVEFACTCAYGCRGWVGDVCGYLGVALASRWTEICSMLWRNELLEAGVCWRRSWSLAGY